MALVSGGRSSTLNPNAPIFVPAALRQVEDFSPEWWNLVTTSSWFHDYWVSQQEGDNFYAADVEEDDIAHLLPETFDLGADDDFFTMEAQLEEFLQLSESEGNKFSQPASRAVPKSGIAGLETYPEPVIKSLSLTKIVKDLTPKHSFEPAQYQEKPAKRVGPKLSPRCIQQPR